MNASRLLLLTIAVSPGLLLGQKHDELVSIQRDVAQLEPAAMKGKGKKVEPLTRDGKDLYRTSITGFASRDAAEAFCGKLKAAGKDCIVK